MATLRSTLTGYAVTSDQTARYTALLRVTHRTVNAAGSIERKNTDIRIGNR